MPVKHFLVQGRLSASCRHHFTIIVHRVNDGQEEYYELKSKYHKLYPSSPFFHWYWHHVVRRKKEASGALSWRTRKVLARAKIVPTEFRYMTSIQKGIRQRHFIAVKVLESDFEDLFMNGMLKTLYRGKKDVTAMKSAVLGNAAIVSAYYKECQAA